MNGMPNSINCWYIYWPFVYGYTCSQGKAEKREDFNSNSLYFKNGGRQNPASVDLCYWVATTINTSLKKYDEKEFYRLYVTCKCSYSIYSFRLDSMCEKNEEIRRKIKSEPSNMTTLTMVRVAGFEL